MAKKVVNSLNSFLLSSIYNKQKVFFKIKNFKDNASKTTSKLAQRLFVITVLPLSSFYSSASFLFVLCRLFVIDVCLSYCERSNWATTKKHLTVNKVNEGEKFWLEKQTTKHRLATKQNISPCFLFQRDINHRIKVIAKCFSRLRRHIIHTSRRLKLKLIETKVCGVVNVRRLVIEKRYHSTTINKSDADLAKMPKLNLKIRKTADIKNSLTDAHHSMSKLHV